MEAAILAVAVTILVLGLIAFYVITEQQRRDRLAWKAEIKALQSQLCVWAKTASEGNANVESVLESVEDIREVLTEASRRNAVRNGTDEPAMPRRNGRKFIGISERRAAAERISQGPVSRADRTREANAKAMEG